VVESFQGFLASNSLPGTITWVFRDDTWLVSPEKLVVLSPPRKGNALLAAKVYEEGRAKGLVEIVAIGRTQSRTVATVWFPKFAEDEVQGWSVGSFIGTREWAAA
jgi:hypothetical protein